MRRLYGMNGMSERTKKLLLGPDEAIVLTSEMISTLRAECCTTAHGDKNLVVRLH
jgi:hypothetical protein